MCGHEAAGRWSNLNENVDVESVRVHCSGKWCDAVAVLWLCFVSLGLCVIALKP